MGQMHPLLYAAELLFKARPAQPGRYEMVIIDNELVIRRRDPYEKTAYQICTLTSQDINEGVIIAKWDIIDDRLRVARKEGLL